MCAGAFDKPALAFMSSLRRSGMQRSSRVDYDALAALYDSTPHREKSADPELITFLAGRAPTATLTLLDIACGTGNLLLGLGTTMAPEEFDRLAVDKVDFPLLRALKD